MQDLFDLSRNHYDRIGHFAQGFIPAILVREILLRLSPLKRGKWLFFLVVSVCLAFSAFYEFIEWWAAVLGGDAATTAFLGTQGDMLLCMLGAIISQSVLNKRHDLALDKMHVGI
jgi:putative membrane protein